MRHLGFGFSECDDLNISLVFFSSAPDGPSLLKSFRSDGLGGSVFPKHPRRKAVVLVAVERGATI